MQLFGNAFEAGYGEQGDTIAQEQHRFDTEERSIEQDPLSIVELSDTLINGDDILDRHKPHFFDDAFKAGYNN
jgi:hypothetical protein